jgi:membrane-associated phospholipid phosphatase
MGRRGDLRQMFWLVVISGLITCAGAAFFPALGPFKAHGIKAEFLPVMEQLRAGNLHFALSNLTGVVSFPSFHTTMALLFIYSFSRAGTIGWLLAMLNVVMLPSIPFFGGHYLVDMAGGAAVALGSLALVKAAARTSSGQHVTSGAYTGLFGVGMGHQREPAH